MLFRMHKQVLQHNFFSLGGLGGSRPTAWGCSYHSLCTFLQARQSRRRTSCVWYRVHLIKYTSADFPLSLSQSTLYIEEQFDDEYKHFQEIQVHNIKGRSSLCIANKHISFWVCELSRCIKQLRDTNTDQRKACVRMFPCIDSFLLFIH